MLHIIHPSCLENITLSYEKFSDKCKYITKIKSIPELSPYNSNTKKKKVRKEILHNIGNNIDNNLVLGSGHSLGHKDKYFPGFISTDQDELDLVNRFEITQYIPKESFLTILANHVLEHIHPELIWNVFENINFMNKINGYLVICVPDMNYYRSKYYNNKEEAIKFQPKGGHYIYFSYYALSYFLSETGYEAYPIYYHSKTGKIIYSNHIYKVLRKINLDKYINRSIESDPYSVCVLGIKKRLIKI